jgi:hypothetical protein
MNDETPSDNLSLRDVPLAGGARFGKWTLMQREGQRKWLCKCECGVVKAVDSSNLRAGRSTSCNSGACRTPSRPATAERFWSHVNMTGGEGACWPWVGAIGKKGYGVLSWNGYTYAAHRVAAWLGGVIEDPYEGKGLYGLLVGHECDNKVCCNPKHLRRTTTSQNTKEMWERVRRGKTK